MLQMILERREEMKNGVNLDCHDFLTTMLQNDQYKDNNDMIIDECMTFFVAGFMTTNALNSNLLVYLMLNERCKDKVMQEI